MFTYLFDIFFLWIGWCIILEWLYCYCFCKHLIYNTHWTSWLGLQNTMTASLQRGKTFPTSTLDMTRNNLMVRFQYCWNFRECGVFLHCYYSLAHSGLEGPIYGPNRIIRHLICVLMLNLIVWNRTVWSYNCV